MNKIYLIILALIVCIVGIVLMNVFAMPELVPIIRYVEIEKPVVVKEIQVVEKKIFTQNEDLPLFQKIAEEVANNHNYNLTDFNCEDFSAELAHKLAQEGYKAEVVRGTLKNCNPESDVYECRHAWVKVEVNIEATNGSVLDPNFYEENYKE